MIWFCNKKQTKQEKVVMKNLKFNTWLILVFYATGSLTSLTAGIENCPKYKTQDECRNSDPRNSCVWFGDITGCKYDGY